MQLIEDISRVPQTIIACCILHNICIMMNDQAKVDNETEPENDEDDDNNPPILVAGAVQIIEAIRQLFV